MPPIRNIPPIKPTKTERSHEENQERAYIAASRRSDRSLEARVESARRASEIHKRRTGRSLRVTEQDVVNEEMYEEEDDDIPAQYRRLTAHMNSGSTDFNRRLTAYLSNHVAMRHALGQALSSSYQQFPNGTPWAQSMNAMLSPTGNQISLQAQPSEGSSMVFPALYNSTPPFRQSPYPLPTSHSSRPQFEPNQSPSSPASASTPAIAAADASTSARPKAGRRVSEPLQPKQEDAQTISTKEFGKSASASPLVARVNSSDTTNSRLTNEAKSQHLQPSSNPQYPPTPTSFANTLAFQNMTKQEPHSFGPFSTALPPDAQMFSNAGFDPNDPFGYRLLSDPKNQTFANKLEGMNQTLAPSAFDDMSGGADWSEGDQTDMNVPFSAPPFMYSFADAFDDAIPKGGLVDADDEASGQRTPTEGDWASLIDQSSFEDGPG